MSFKVANGYLINNEKKPADRMGRRFFALSGVKQGGRSDSFLSLSIPFQNEF
jgi:hypothetical protein